VTYDSGHPLRNNLARRLHHDTKRSTPASAKRPEQVRVLTGVGYARSTVGRDDAELEDAVGAEAVGIGKNRVAAAL
jgi:hypothetical protein